MELIVEIKYEKDGENHKYARALFPSEELRSRDITKLNFDRLVNTLMDYVYQDD